MTLEDFFKEVKNLNYVVQRNWENLPDGWTEGHEDLDLFVSEEDERKLLEIVNKYSEIKIDIRSPRDNYYPEEIEKMLLLGAELEKDLFWIPNPPAHFLSLYYHSLIHKEGHPYKEKLKKIFKEAFPPVRCTDEGVGFFV